MSAPAHIARANGMKGGRPKGSVSKETLEREKTLKAFNLRVFKMADKLLNAQAIVALGTHKMVVMTKDSSGIPQVETVRNEKRMQELLDTGVYGKDYLIVMGSEPDWKAADALLNRAMGKAKESVEVKGSLSITDILNSLEDEPGQKTSK